MSPARSKRGLIAWVSFPDEDFRHTDDAGPGFDPPPRERRPGLLAFRRAGAGAGVVYQGEAHAPPYYRVLGERLERIGDNVYRVRRGVFTTCEDEVPTWSFHLGSATADMEDLVYGTNASFWVKGLPIIPFFPFFAAAIRRDRQSGFLAPQLGSSR